MGIKCIFSNSRIYCEIETMKWALYVLKTYLYVLFYYIAFKNTHFSEGRVYRESMKEWKDFKIWRNKTDCGQSKSVNISYRSYIVVLRNKNNICQGPSVVMSRA